MCSTDAVKHVSDTALWVATYRAWESAREDAVFKDELAKLLVGDRGQAIATTMPYRKLMAWVLVVRTSAIDGLIRRAIDSGADTVVNLGAGLDTRPYRMALPESLRWVEVDFPGIIQYKNNMLAREKTVCQLQRLETDLSDPGARRAAIESSCDSAHKAVIVTEGVLPYLSPEEVAALSDELLAQSKIAYWIQDYRQAGRGTALKKLTKRLKDAPLQFIVEDWLEFFLNRGWQIGEITYTHDESKRIGRNPPFVFPQSLVYMAKFLASKRLREKTIRENGYVMFEKSLQTSS
ncbi:MAG: SAM-dependent methyltransferase [Planctomycetales bacterium]|nr:SAM-dependent methyltransferase [Planctomycetales bacterium]